MKHITLFSFLFLCSTANLFAQTSTSYYDWSGIQPICIVKKADKAVYDDSNRVTAYDITYKKTGSTIIGSEKLIQQIYNSTRKTYENDTTLSTYKLVIEFESKESLKQQFTETYSVLESVFKYTASGTLYESSLKIGLIDDPDDFFSETDNEALFNNFDSYVSYFTYDEDENALNKEISTSSISTKLNDVLSEIPLDYTLRPKIYMAFSLDEERISTLSQYTLKASYSIKHQFFNTTLSSNLSTINDIGGSVKINNEVIPSSEIVELTGKSTYPLQTAQAQIGNRAFRRWENKDSFYVADVLFFMSRTSTSVTSVTHRDYVADVFVRDICNPSSPSTRKA